MASYMEGLATWLLEFVISNHDLLRHDEFSVHLCQRLGRLFGLAERNKAGPQGLSSHGIILDACFDNLAKFAEAIK